MALVLDFARIREHRGTQSGGFEELCCQLAALEDPAPGSRFLRKGVGADQGLECYRTYADSSETGWQAKFFMGGFGTGQVSDVRDSLQRALNAHPRLTKFILALPVDLRDNRSGKGASEAQRFERWRAESIETAAANGRALEIELWSASTLTERLGRDLTAYSGRARYWFDQVNFSSAWFQAKFLIQRQNLGDRYSPESHVDLPIAQTLEAIARDTQLLAEPAVWAAEITYKLDGVARLLVGAPAVSTTRLRACIEPLIASLGAEPAKADEAVPVEAWKVLTSTAVDGVTAALSEPDERDNEVSVLRRGLYELYSALSETQWRFINEQALVISGPAGIGKSHLLADFGATQLDQGLPFILVLTSTLTEGEPFEQIRLQLDVSTVSTADFLGALDAAAEAAGSRALLAIDALNENHGVALWETRLQGFVALIKQFPRLAVVFTVRQTYADYLPLGGLARIRHPGFAGHAGAAAKAYLDRRGIARPSSPHLAREFENPLFLRTCCTYLDADDRKRLPKGLDGITAIFNFYLSAVAQKVDRDLKLVPQLKIARRALDGFLDASAKRLEQGPLALHEAVDLLDRYHASGGRVDRSLLTAFLSEGVLTQELDWDNGARVEIVRFTFDRLSDHLLAKRLIESASRDDVAGSFKQEPLASYASPERSWRVAGVVEALAVQIPEAFGLELFDVFPADAIQDSVVVEAFDASLAWRSPMSFTERTLEWVAKAAEWGGSPVYDALLVVSTEPDNKFNADYLDAVLWPKALHERDAGWSIFLAQEDLREGGTVDSLIDWAWRVEPGDDVDDERLRLAGIALTWLLTTSNRAVRDRATKALANLLSTSLNQAADLLSHFVAVNDPYVIERLLAACYGAALQGHADEYQVLARSVWGNYFAADRRPLAHLLARDYAIGILQHSQVMGALPEEASAGDWDRLFSSVWPPESEVESKIAVLCEQGYGDSIASSAGAHGDFGHYTVRGWLQHITSCPREFAGQTTKQLFDVWEQRFEGSATDEQLEAYRALRKRARDYRGRQDRGWFSEKGKRESDRLWATFSNANKTFKTTLHEASLSEYTKSSEHYLVESTRMDDDHRGPADLDERPVLGWIRARAHELGWTEQRFSEFDDGPLVSRERIGTHRIERIGKKYQRIALAEVAARLADHFAVCSYEDKGMLRSFAYTPASFNMKRDLDPSLLLTITRATGWSSTPQTWWTLHVPTLPSGSLDLLLAWVAVESDLGNAVQDIEVQSPDGQKWLVADGFRHWTVPGHSRRNHADAWSRVTCLITRRGDGPTLAAQLSKRQQTDASHLRGDTSVECFLGEHGWREDVDIQLRADPDRGISVPFAEVVNSFAAEGNGEDNSIDESISLQLPSSGIMSALGLRLRSGKVPEYLDSTGIVRWQDPSLRERGPTTGLVSRDFFIERLQEAGYEPVWVLAGEKNVYAGAPLSGQGFGGSLSHTTLFCLDAGTLTRLETRTAFQPATKEQLRGLRDAE